MLNMPLASDLYFNFVLQESYYGERIVCGKK